jgi:GPH family glycoside/pentoside/hexuronide:cation symporter
MISFGARLGYGLGGAMFSIKEAAYSAFVILFYTQVLGLSGTGAGVALAVAVVFDALSDPVIGAWSDRLHGRWGRRHPFMVAGTLPMGLGFIGLFLVPDVVVASQALLALWLAFWSIWIRTTLSVFAIPHLALSAEITSNYRERSSILGARMFFVFLFTVLIPASALVLLFDQYGDIDGRFQRDNYPLYGLLSCIGAWGVGLLTIWSTRRYATPHAGADPAGAAPSIRGLRDFVTDFLGTLRIENFRQLLAFDVAASVSYGVLIATHMLASVYFWELSSRDIALILAIPSLIGVSGAMFAIHWLGSRVAKHTILQLTCAMMIIDGVWPYAARLAGLLPENGHPAVFWSLFLQMLLWMFFFILRGIASQSLVADIADENELANGRRQEGALFAATLFAQKLASALGPLYAGMVLDMVGLQRGMAPGTIPQPTLDAFAIYLALGILTPLLVAMYFSFRVSLSEERLQEIQAALGRRDADPG